MLTEDEWARYIPLAYLAYLAEFERIVGPVRWNDDRAPRREPMLATIAAVVAARDADLRAMVMRWRDQGTLIASEDYLEGREDALSGVLALLGDDDADER